MRIGFAIYYNYINIKIMTIKKKNDCSYLIKVAIGMTNFSARGRFLPAETKKEKKRKEKKKEFCNCRVLELLHSYLVKVVRSTYSSYLSSSWSRHGRESGAKCNPCMAMHWPWCSTWLNELRMGIVLELEPIKKLLLSHQTVGVGC